MVYSFEESKNLIMFLLCVKNVQHVWRIDAYTFIWCLSLSFFISFILILSWCAHHNFHLIYSFKFFGFAFLVGLHLLELCPMHRLKWKLISFSNTALFRQLETLPHCAPGHRWGHQGCMTPHRALFATEGLTFVDEGEKEIFVDLPAMIVSRFC